VRSNVPEAVSPAGNSLDFANHVYLGLVDLCVDDRQRAGFFVTFHHDEFVWDGARVLGLERNFASSGRVRVDFNAPLAQRRRDCGDAGCRRALVLVATAGQDTCCCECGNQHQRELLHLVIHNVSFALPHACEPAFVVWNGAFARERTGGGGRASDRVHIRM